MWFSLASRESRVKGSRRAGRGRGQRGEERRIAVRPGGRRVGRGERDVAAEEGLDGPVEQDPEPPLDAWQLAEVDAAPHQPGQDAGEAPAPDVGHGAVVADGGQEADG